MITVNTLIIMSWWFLIFLFYNACHKINDIKQHWWQALTTTHFQLWGSKTLYVAVVYITASTEGRYIATKSFTLCMVVCYAVHMKQCSYDIFFSLFVLHHA